MIIQELIDNNYHTYSDAGVKIHGGMPESDYNEAYDVIQRQYTETDIPIDTDDDDEDATIEDYEQALTRLGVE